MKIKELHEDIERYLDEDCYCPNEVYALDGFFYQNYYPELKENREVVLEVLRNEKIKFNRTLEKGLREFEKILSQYETFCRHAASNLQKAPKKRVHKLKKSAF